MKAQELRKGIYWVGAIDWNVRSFHGHTYTVKNGTTYNAYLILDDKITLVDTVYGPFQEEMFERIKAVRPIEKIEYIVANHLELDHTGALPQLMNLCPKAKIFGTQKCKDGMYRHFYKDWDFQVVKTGDELKLGRRTLTFIEAAMIHWPDSMFTYCEEEKLLLPNDAFGQHYATSERFDDEGDPAVLMDEAAKYYANILWPFSSIILKKIEEIKGLGIPIEMIAPSHGVIWRKDTAKIINTYLSWAKNDARSKVVIVYETMYGATERMAKAISEGIIDSGVSVKLFDVTKSDRSELIKEMLDAKGYIIGSSTHDNDMLPTLAGFMEFLKGMKPKNRIGAAFGSYGWAGGAVGAIERIFKEAGVEVTQPSLAVKYAPDENEMKRCYELGSNFARSLKTVRV